MRGLLVDESVAMQDFLAFVLSGISGMQFDRGTNGIEAVERLSQHRYDVVLLELDLPLLDGMNVLGALRASNANKETPVIIIITTEAPPETIRAARELGVRDVLFKPIDCVEVVDAVRKCLGLPTSERSSQEYRRAPRVQIPFCITVQGQPPVETVSWDISLHGAFVICDTIYPIGTPLVLLLRIPLRGDLTLQGRVMHVRPRAVGSLPKGIGVRFEQQNAATLRALMSAFRSPS
jgi:two-component system chemotaxis response regulator CheY